MQDPLSYQKQMLLVAMQAEHNFVRFFAIGFSFLILVEVTISVGMNIGLLPIVGLPLPFVSYGGSSLFMLFVGLGILQSIKANSISS